MFKTRIATVLVILLAAGAHFTWAETSQKLLPNSLSIDEIHKYLVIAMGDDADVGRAFLMSNSEIGADREVLSTPSDPGFPTNGSFPNLLDVFDDRSTGGSNNRWDTSSDPDIVSVSGFGVVSPAESIDWSGEVALTSNGGRFDFSNSLVFADTGVQGTVSNPVQGASNSEFLDVGDTTPAEATPLALNNGATGSNDFTALLSELGDWKTFIEGLPAEITITSLSTPYDFQNNEALNGVINGVNGLITTYGSANDTNSDGVVIIDINLSGDFSLTNLDWAIIINDDVLPIFRLRNGSNMILNNVSILVNHGCCGDIRAIFYSGYEGSSSGDTVFNGGSNVILNGIGLWDLNAVGEGGGDIKTNININNAQGCAQFISQQVNFQNNRWNRCALAQPRASLGDRVWEDMNADGIQDIDESGVPDVTVKLYTCDHVFVSETTTDATGYYLFDNLVPGEYYVEFSNLPSLYIFSPQDQGTDDAADSDANPLDGRTVCTTLDPGEHDDTWDAGIFDEAAVPTLLQSSETGWVDSGVELSWRLSEVSPTFLFSLQRQAGNSNMATVADAVLHRNGAEFTYRDHTAEAGQAYIYRVVLDSGAGPYVLFETTVTTPALGFALYPNRPNPFNPSTTISYSLDRAARVHLRILDAQGRVVRTLVNEHLPVGSYSTVWSGRGDDGRPLASGIYISELKTDTRTVRQRMMLVK